MLRTSLSRSVSLVANSRYVNSTRAYGSETQSTKLATQEILAKVKASGHSKIKVAAVDIDGVLRGKYVSLEKFESALSSGMGFCSVIFGWDLHDKIYDNCDFTGDHTGFPDMTASVDEGSLRFMPWEKKLPFMLVDFIDDESVKICPRKLLRNVCKKFEEEVNGLPYCGPELEFYSFSETTASLHEKNFENPKPFTPGMFGYSALRTGQNQSLMHDIYDECKEFGVEIEGLHTETGPGVLEAAIRYSSALLAADNVVLFKYATKIIGQKYGMVPCFMAKPYHAMPGCSGHLHQSIIDKDTGDNLFYDASAPNKMSKLFKHYVAGQLFLLPKFLPMLCPTVNSYKRLVHGYWAPVEATWGVENRTSSIRVIPGSKKATRVETRIPGADANPYLSIAASLAAGLYGIRHKLELPNETVGTEKVSHPERRLAPNLYEATQTMKASEEAVEMFGKEFVKHFADTREWEWKEYMDNFHGKITPWEFQRYAEII